MKLHLPLSTQFSDSPGIAIYMYVYNCLWETHTKNSYAKMHGWNYVVQTYACSKSVLGV